MFKFTPQSRLTARSVIAASFRLYFASFKYTLALALAASLTFYLAFWYLSGHLSMDNQYSFIAVMTYDWLLAAIFLIPLTKRIYSVGAQLPISTQHAFDGFFSHYIRLAIFFCSIAFFNIAVTFVFSFITLPAMGNLSVFIIMSFIYLYLLLKIYFIPMFIILEDRNILKAAHASFTIEYHHMWLTFCVIALYFIVYWTFNWLVRPWIEFDVGGVELYPIILGTLFIPFFICVQICQFFNLKSITQYERMVAEG